jgi:ferredoxin
MKLRIVVDRKACQSIATCVSTAPELFALDSEAKAIVTQAKGKKSSPDKMAYELDATDSVTQKAVLAAEACPYLAIEVYNDDSGQRLFPKGK